MCEGTIATLSNNVKAILRLTNTPILADIALSLLAKGAPIQDLADIPITDTRKQI